MMYTYSKMLQTLIIIGTLHCSSFLQAEEKTIPELSSSIENNLHKENKETSFKKMHPQEIAKELLHCTIRTTRDTALGLVAGAIVLVEIGIEIVLEIPRFMVSSPLKALTYYSEKKAEQHTSKETDDSPF